MIEVSDKVVCVGPHPKNVSPTQSDYTFPNGIPESGKVYVVHGFAADGQRIGLKLVGIPVFWKHTGKELGWDIRCFRKLEEIQREAREMWGTNHQP